MARKRWEPGTVVRKSLDDDWTYYARLLEFPWAAFYRHRTREPSDQLAEIVASPVLFTIAAHKDLVAEGEWKPVGRIPLDGSLRPPAEQAMWNVADPEHPRIIDDRAEMRPTTPAEAVRLEPAAVWEPEHIADRLKDAFANRPNKWLQSLIPAAHRR